MKTHIMDSDRFQAVVEAYGAEPRRWPEAERAAAQAFMRQNPALTQTWLDEARGLDRLLDALPAAETLSAEEAEALYGRAMAQLVPEAETEAETETRADMGGRVVAFRGGPARPLPVIWATGIGMAACIAGAVFGVNVSQSSLRDLRAQNVLEQTQMMDADSFGAEN